MTDIQVKLTEFSDLIARYTADFVGREWLVKQVDALLTDPECRFVLLTGGPGVGKTAFLAHLAATHPQWPRYFIRRDSKDLIRPGDANTFLLTVGGQLATLYPHLFHPKNLEIVARQRIGSVEAGGEATGARIEELHASPFYRVALLAEQEIRRVAGKASALEIGRLVTEPRLMQMQDLQYLGLLDPAWLLARENPDARIVVLVDALDELRYSPAEPDILRALRELPEVPPNLRFVISSRPEAFLGRLLARSEVRELPLDVAGADNQTDLRTYAESVVGGDGWKPMLEQEGLGPEAFVDGLLGKAAGNFLYLKSVLGGFQQALEDPAKRERLSRLLCVEELPGELGVLYGYFLSFILDWVRDSLGQDAWQKYLRPFLGVLAVAQEPLSEEQIIAFTDLKRESIRDLQRELRQFVETVDGQSPVYRIYHTSFAEYLLDSEQNRDYWIDGRKAHAHISERYLEPWGGFDASLPGLQDLEKRDLDGGYGLRHLAAHLEGAGRVHDLHRLLALETSERRNAWHKARETVGDAAGYIADVARAWRLADEACSPDDNTRAGQSVGLQNRYALITVSLNSLAENIPPALLAALVEKRVWLPTQGLAHIRQVPDPKRRAEALPGLTSHLPAPLLREALAAAREIRNKYCRSKALAELASHLPESLLQEALAAAREIEDEPYRAEVLAGLVPHLPEPLKDEVLREALAAARGIEDGWRRAYALVGLASHLSEPLKGEVLPEALAAARRIPDIWGTRAGALAGLVPRLAELGYPQEALAATREIRNEWDRVKLLAGLAPHLLEPLRGEAVRQALTAAREIENEWSRAKALVKLVPHLPEQLKGEVLREVLATAQQITSVGYRAGALIDLAPHLPEPLLREALAAARGIEDEWHRAYALVELAPHLPELLRGEVLQEALAAARGIEDEWHRVKALTGLASYLPEPLLREALAAAREIDGESYQAEALAGLTPRLAELGYPQEALTTAREIEDEWSRAKALVGLASYLPESLLREALAAVREIQYEKPRAYALVGLVPHLPKPLVREVLAAVREIRDADSRAYVLTGLAPHLSEPLLREALAATRGIRDERDQAMVLAELALRLAELGYPQEALAAAREVWDEWSRAKALVGLASYLPESLLREALAAVREIRDADSRAHVLTGLALHLPEPLKGEVLQEALAAAQGIEDEWSRAYVLAGLASYLPEPLRGEVLQEALAAARGIEDEWSRAETLAGLAPRLAELGYPQEALAAVREIRGTDRRAEALAGLAPYLPEVLLREVLAAAWGIEDEWSRAETLAGLAPHLAEPSLQEALAAAQEIGDKWDRAVVLAGVAPRLAELGYPQEALVAAREIEDEPYRAEVLAGLVPHLPEPLKDEVLREALAVVREIQDADSRVYVLAGLAPHLPEPLKGEVLQETLATARKIGDERRRTDALVGLAFHLPEPLRGEVLQEALAAAWEIGDEKYLAKALTTLAPYLPDPLLGEAIAAAMEIEEEYYLVQSLTVLTAQLVELPNASLSALWQETLRTLVTRTRRDSLVGLRILTPVIVALGGQEAVVETFRAIQDVGRWWP